MCPVSLWRITFYVLVQRFLMTWRQDLLAFCLGNQRAPSENPSPSSLSQILWVDVGWTVFICWLGVGPSQPSLGSGRTFGGVPPRAVLSPVVIQQFNLLESKLLSQPWKVKKMRQPSEKWANSKD